MKVLMNRERQGRGVLDVFHEDRQAVGVSTCGGIAKRRAVQGAGVAHGNKRLDRIARPSAAAKRRARLSKEAASLRPPNGKVRLGRASR